MSADVAEVSFLVSECPLALIMRDKLGCWPVQLAVGLKRPADH